MLSVDELAFTPFKVPILMYIHVVSHLYFLQYYSKQIHAYIFHVKYPNSTILHQCKSITGLI